VLDLRCGILRGGWRSELHFVPCGRHDDRWRRGQHIRGCLHGLRTRLLWRRDKPGHLRRGGLRSVPPGFLLERWRYELQRLRSRLLLWRERQQLLTVRGRHLRGLGERN
jgi:hypothetical protein